jgi:hypothetical protein
VAKRAAAIKPEPDPEQVSDGGIVGDAWQAPPADVPEIGHEAFHACRATLETVRAGQSRSILVYGAAGSGKTHLISRLHRYIEQCNSASWLDSIFVYIRLQTAPAQIWRYVRRRFAGYFAAAQWTAVPIGARPVSRYGHLRIARRCAR